MPILRVQTVYTGLPGLPGISTLFFDGATALAAETAHEAVQALWNSLAGGLDESLTMTVAGDVVAYDETDGSVFNIFSVGEQVIQGESTVSEPLPFAIQALMHFSTQGIVHNRRVAGRIFIPGYTENVSTDGVIDPTTRVAIASLATTALSQGGANQMVWSRPFDGTPGNPAREGSAYPVSNIFVNEQWAVLRSRRP